MKKIWKNSIVLSLLGLAFLVFVWGVAFLAVKDAYVLPSPSETVKQAVKLLGKGYFYAAFFATLGRAVLGFAIACVLGVGLAVLAYVLPTLEKLLRGVVAMLRSLPTMAVLLLVLLGVSYAFAPVIIGVLTLFPLMYTATYSSLCGVDRKLLEMSEIYRVPLKKRVMNLYLPTAFPKIVAEGVAALSFSLKLTVSAEVLAFTYRSIGVLIQDASIAGEAATMMGLTLLVCLLGALMEFIGITLVGKWEERQCA